MISMAHTIGGGSIGPHNVTGVIKPGSENTSSQEMVFFHIATSLNLEAVFSNSTLSDADATEHSIFKLFKLGQKYNLDQG